MKATPLRAGLVTLVAAAPLALSAPTTASNPYSFVGYQKTEDGPIKAHARWYPDSNTLCADLARGARARASLVGQGSRTDRAADDEMRCRVITATNGKTYRLKITWVGSDGSTGSASIRVKG